VFLTNVKLVKRIKKLRRMMDPQLIENAQNVAMIKCPMHHYNFVQLMKAKQSFSLA